MKGRLGSWVRLALLPLLIVAVTPGTAKTFFEGKTMRILVGFSPGGGYDAYARMFARYMKRHIPGNPEIIVQNMPGGGGLRAANYLYKVAKRDGLTLEHLTRDAYFLQFTGQPGVQYDTSKMIPLGSATYENMVVFLSNEVVPYRTLAELKEAVSGGKEVFIGGTGLAGSGYTLWKTVEALTGITVKHVLAYPGSTEVHLAIRKKEVAGFGQSKSSFVLQARDLLNADKIAILAQLGTKDRKRDPDFPDAPSFWELAKTKQQSDLVSVGAAASVGGRPFFLPPGVPADRVKILRDAFMKAAEDPDLLAESKKIRRPVDPVGGKVLEDLYKDIFAIAPAEQKEITRLFTGK